MRHIAPFMMLFIAVPAMAQPVTVDVPAARGSLAGIDRPAAQ